MRTFCLVFCILIGQLSFAQGFKVKGFELNMNDGSAFHAPLDAEGHPCGLIKVRTDSPDLQFKGDIVGDVENKMNEYWVYMSPSAKLLKVIHPKFMPLIIPFSDYGIDVSSKATYILTLEEIKYKKEKAEVTIIVKPENADLYIDDILIDNMSGNGYYQMYLPKGEHVCKLSKTGYRPNVQVVQTGKASQNISVELESLMAELEVKCKTVTAEIYVDGELKGNGTWKGNLLAGEHKIEARQQNFNSHSQTITLAEKENKAIVVPELKRSMGKLCIETVPSNLPVMVDGKSVGSSPCTIDIESGKHYVSCNTYGCIPYRSDVEISSGKTSSMGVMIKFDEGNSHHDDYVKAYNGNEEAIKELAETIIGQVYRGNTNDPRKDSEEAIFWAERYPQTEELFDFEGWLEAYCYAGKPEKALQLYPSIKRMVDNNGGMFLSEHYMKRIGDSFMECNEIDKAIECYEKADEHGYEGLGDCYVAKDDKQRAATYYKKCLSLDYYEGKNIVVNKLKELGY